MKKEVDEKIEYYVFTYPISIWKGDRELVYKSKFGWRGHTKGIFNDFYQGIIPDNIRKASKEEIEYGKSHDGNLYGYETEEDKINKIKEQDEYERVEYERLKNKFEKA